MLAHPPRPAENTRIKNPGKNPNSRIFGRDPRWKVIYNFAPVCCGSGTGGSVKLIVIIDPDPYYYQRFKEISDIKVQYFVIIIYYMPDDMFLKVVTNEKQGGPGSWQMIDISPGTW